MKLTSLLLTIFLVGACSLNNKVVLNSHIDNKNGVLITKLSCSKNLMSTEFYKSGVSVKGKLYSLSFYRSGYILCNDDYHILELEPGNYYFGSILRTAPPFITFQEKDAVKFTIKQGEINYIGDLSYSAKIVRTGSSYRDKVYVTIPKDGISREDNINAVIKYLEKGKYPNLKKYRFINGSSQY